MSSSENARTATQGSRRTTAAASAKPRVTSTRVDRRDSSTLDDELHPQDSASNAPHRRVPSSSKQPSGSHRGTMEKRTERTRIMTKETVQIQTRSPPQPGSAGTINGTAKVARDPIVGKPTVQPRSPQRKGKETEVPWKPKAGLVPHTTAPLAARASLPPLSSLLPDYLQPTPLKELSAEAQETAILEDLLFAFMGYEGQYIQYTKSYDPSVERSRLAGPGFKSLPGLDTSLQDLTTTMLKMATHYSAVEAFVEVQSREEFGTINHALCASIRKVLKEYLVLIAQLEHKLLTSDSFTLHVLHLHILPTMQQMVQLYTLAQEMIKRNPFFDDDPDDSLDDFDMDDILEQLRDGGDLVPGSMSKKILKGGNVLRLLTERLSFMSGDPAARDLLQGLLRDASQPYMAMLNEWLHHGAIKDPHAEFLIKEQKSIKRDKLEEDYTDEYWEKRYTIRDGDVPPQLEAVKEKVLLAGKYLNVVRECGGVDISTQVQDVPFSFDDPRFLNNVNTAYAHANSSLLNLLLTTHGLPSRLRSLKHYFFLDQSDFFSYFLFLSDSELKKPAKLVNVGKLQSLLDLVLRQSGSVAAQDPYKEDVKIQMNDQYLTKFLMGVVNVRGFDQDGEETIEKHRTPAPPHSVEEDAKMTGFEALEFKYSVPFPLSLVISSKTVVRYQILFRYLLSMRHLEGLIVNSWTDHNKVISWTHKSSDRRLELWKRRAWTLRSRMLNFVQQFMYYCTSEVIEPNWQNLMLKVNGDGDENRTGQRAPRTVDELMEDHVDFLDTCLKECMLMNSRLLRIHAKILSCCTLFSTYTASLSRTLFTADPDLTPSTIPLSLTNPPKNNKLHLSTLAYLTALFPPTPRHPHSQIPERLLKYDPQAIERMEDMLKKYEDNFQRHLDILRDALDYYAATETVRLGRLCALLGVGERGEGGRGLG